MASYLLDLIMSVRETHSQGGPLLISNPVPLISNPVPLISNPRGTPYKESPHFFAMQRENESTAAIRLIMSIKLHKFASYSQNLSKIGSSLHILNHGYKCDVNRPMRMQECDR